jgi:hypothetical protein
MANSAVPHNDLPTLEDKLDWKDELKRLRQRIADCDAPHVLGIHGDWGSGKTSFMRQLQSWLGGEIPEDGSVSGVIGRSSPAGAKALQNRIVTIWFDAWRYQHEPVPVVALLQEMRRQMSTVASVQKKFTKTLEIALRYTLNSLTDSAEKIKAEGESWEKEHHATTLHTDSIRAHLHATIKALLPDKPNARIVVFIDDLDRCNSTAAFRLLEELKIYLSISNCVFVLGMNERILVDAISKEIPSSDGGVGETRAAHYLEKICSDIYRLPLPGDTARLFANWLHETEPKHALISALAEISCLPPNPRRLKALANQWERFAGYVAFPETGTEEQEIWAMRALIAAYIHQFHRDIWERWHYTPDFWNEIRAWCLGERGSTNVINTDDPARPDWTRNLRLTYQIGWNEESKPIQKRDFPNPGAIENFWIGSLISKHPEELDLQSFEPLLRQ